LVLLCPTHHRTIDKAPAESYPPDLLREWKRDHERRVRDSLAAEKSLTRSELFALIRRLLSENRQVWLTYGPESEVAKRNPLSNLAEVWKLRKVTTIVPNNRKIINIVRANGHLMTSAEYDIACRFIEHAEGFEQSCYRRREGVPRFPSEFEAMVHGSKKRNNWDVSYSTIAWFEKAIKTHKNVATVTRERDIYFRIARQAGFSAVRAVLVNEYVLGLAAVLRARQEFPDATCIVTGGEWNSYTEEAKSYGAAENIGIFVPSEFFGALYVRQPNKYIKKDASGDPIYHYARA
jgi:hypothetical protein